MQPIINIVIQIAKDVKIAKKMISCDHKLNGRLINN